MPELLIEPASIVRLVRLFLAATPSTAPGDASAVSSSESREEAGTLLWDISVSQDGAAAMLGFSVMEAAEAVLAEALEGSSATARDAELALGILANLAAFPRLCARLLGHAALAELVCEGALHQLTDPPALCEACRLLTAVCDPQAAMPWASRLCTMPVLERLLWIVTNTLDATLRQRCLELISALLQAQQSLAPAVCGLGLPAALVEALTDAARTLVPQPSAEQVQAAVAATATHDTAAHRNAAGHPAVPAGGAADAAAGSGGAAQHSSWSDDVDTTPQTAPHSGWTETEQPTPAGQPPRMDIAVAEATACAALACLQELGGSGAGRAAVTQHQALGDAALQLLRCEAAAVLGRLLVALTLHEQALLPQLAASAALIEALSRALGMVDRSDEDALDGAWYLLAAALAQAGAAQPAAAEEAGALEAPGAAASVANGDPGAVVSAPAPNTGGTANDTEQGQQVADVAEGPGSRSAQQDKLLFCLPSMVSRLSDSPIPSTSQRYAAVCCQHMLDTIQQAMSAAEHHSMGHQARGAGCTLTHQQLQAAHEDLLTWQNRLQRQSEGGQQGLQQQADDQQQQPQLPLDSSGQQRSSMDVRAAFDAALDHSTDLEGAQQGPQQQADDQQQQLLHGSPGQRRSITDIWAAFDAAPDTHI